MIQKKRLYSLRGFMMKLTIEKLKQIINEEISEMRRVTRYSRALIDNARVLSLYRPLSGNDFGMQDFPIIRKEDGDFMRFFINDNGEEIEIFPNQGGQKFYRHGTNVTTGERRYDLIPESAKEGFELYGPKGHIKLK